MFRNIEVKQMFWFYGILTVAATIAGWLMFGWRAGIFALILCVIVWSVYGVSTKKRYERMAHLTEEIDRTLHGEKGMDFSSYREGELALLENELSKMLQRLWEQADQLKDDKVKLADFIADISHQIRTPLTAANLILASMRRREAGMIHSSNGDSKCSENIWLHQHTDENMEVSEVCRRENREPSAAWQQEQLKELTRLLSRVEWLIEALLKLARLDAGTVVMKQENVEWRSVVEKALQPLLIPIELKEQNIIYDDISGSFAGDLSWTVEAVGNILKNCMEHTPSQGCIRISAVENPLYTELKIRDDGPGIAPEDLPYLFQRFYKGRGSDNQSVGIGLALAKNIICHQGGQIKVGNHPDGGAMFQIRFYKSVV